MGINLIERISDEVEGFTVRELSDEYFTFFAVIHGHFGEEDSYVVTQYRLGLPGSIFNHERVNVTKSKSDALQLAYGCAKAFCEWFHQDYSIDYEDKVNPNYLIKSRDWLALPPYLPTSPIANNQQITTGPKDGGDD